MCSFKSIYFVIFVLNLCKINAQISDKRLCFDAECKEPLSLAKTLLRYPTSGPGILSFAPNEQVTVYSKEAGTVSNLWGVEINGRRGYVPKTYVREYKVIRKPTLLVDTELKQDPQVPLDKKNSIEPDKLEEPFEVVDGTTIYTNPQDTISPSTTASPIAPTAVPSSNKEEGDGTETLKPDKGLKDGIEKVPEKESVVGNVFSSISNWMKDDLTSEEIDDLEDENDEDEEDIDEGEDEEEDENTELAGSEENLREHAILQKPEDTISLHNLPSGVSVSPYGLEIDTNKSVESEEVEQKVNEPNKPSSPEIQSNVLNSIGINSQASADNSDKKAVESSDTSGKSDQKPTEASVAPPEIPPKPLANIDYASTYHPSPSGGNEINSSDTKPQLESKPELEANVKESQEKPLNVEVQTEIPDIQTQQSNTPPAVETPETVTPPTYGEEGEQVPIVDEVTPNPVTSKLIPEETEQAPVGQEKVIDTNNQQFYKPDLSVDVQQSSDLSQENLHSSIVTEPENDKNLETSAGVSQSSAFGDLVNVVQNTLNPVVEDTESKTTLTEDASTPKDEIPEEVINEKSTEQVDVEKQNVGNAVDEQVEESPSIEDVGVSKEQYNVLDDVTNDVQQAAEVNKSEDQGSDDLGNIENHDMKQAEDEVGVENSDTSIDSKEELDVKENEGLFSSILSLFGAGNEKSDGNVEEKVSSPQNKESVIDYCDASTEMCNNSQEKDFTNQKTILEDIELSFNSDIFLYLLTTSISVIIFLFGYMVLDRSRREGPLVARINKLEKELLITLKENELLQEQGSSLVIQEVQGAPSEAIEQLMQSLQEQQLVNQALEARIVELSIELESKEALEEQIESLEKELETSTEVGMELNRIISEMLDPTNGSEKLKENVEQFQRQLFEQKDTINTVNLALKEKETENRVVREELEKSKRKSSELQGKLEEMVDKVLQIEKEKDQQQGTLQNEITVYHQKYSEAISKVEMLNNEIRILRVQLTEVQRQADIKTKENKMLQDSVEKIKSLKNDRDALRSLLDSTSIKAELQQLKSENENYVQQLQHETSLKDAYEKKYQSLAEEVNLLHQKYEQADKEKVEANSRLEVLNNYFKKREAELQEEVIKYKSIWEVKEGEATSTTERIKYMQEEIENYKAQNETLKQEIISQEIDLKSQISMLEKKVHENWVTARQTERKLEDAKQEAAQLRNRLTLRERAIHEERAQNRLQSPLDQNGELPLSPHPIDSPASPPLLYSGRDHITKSPPIPGLPPFLPPPPGAPFMPPPPHGMPPFMPPPPSMFPGDHRPPPLGRMSSPPLNSRYSPDASAFSPYDHRNSPSPPYDSEYGTSPPPMRGYSPYNSRDDRRDYKRPPHVRTNGRNMKGSVISSGSEHSNDSLEKINRKQSKKV